MEVKRYSELEDYIRMFAHKKSDLLVIRGPPGTGKTYTTKKILEEETENYAFINSHLTPLQGYKKLYYASKEGGGNNAPVIIDDIDQLIKNKSLLSLLKQAGDTYSEKHIQWNTSNKMEVPKEFTTRSNLLIIANTIRTSNLNQEALLDRGFVIDFEPEKKELISVMEKMVEKSRVEGAKKVLELIKENWIKAPKISLRTLEKGLQLKEWGTNWEKRLKKEMGVYSKEAEMKEELKKKIETGKKVSECVEEIADKYGYSKRHIWNKKKEWGI